MHQQKYLQKAWKEKQMEADSVGGKMEGWIALYG